MAHASEVQPIRLSLRPAVADDLEFLAESHRSAQRAVESERGGRLDILLRRHGEPIEDAMSLLLGEPDLAINVGEVDDVAVGYMVCSFETLRSGEQMCRVDDLWVHSDARGVGVGGALMRNAVEAAEAKGCTGIDARALPGDRVTKNFFESFGLVARTIEVHKAL